jgi:hypothetical protein
MSPEKSGFLDKLRSICKEPQIQIANGIWVLDMSVLYEKTEGPEVTHFTVRGTIAPLCILTCTEELIPWPIDQAKRTLKRTP